jgi:carbamoyl-phosphate synthase small subunit
MTGGGRGRPGHLILEDGTVFEGTLFGSESTSDGEVVFNTGMVGYPESLTDPSYRGQILTLTYPLAGNYGVPSFEECRDRFESDAIQVRGLVVSSYIDASDHWEAASNLGDWLAGEGIVGLTGIDTRALTMRLRSEGTMLGRIVTGRPEGKIHARDVVDPNSVHLVGEVTTREVVTHSPGRRVGPHIILVDCGCKRSILTSLTERGCRVTTVPCDHRFGDIDADGILVSNGPGDPTMCSPTIEELRRVMKRKDPVPVSGICLGTQIMALAAGGRTFKLPFGHRSQNQPCHLKGTDSYVITSQNHGFAVDPDLPRGWEVWYTNLNDGSVEGIRHRKKPFFSVQFHPEARPGPTDSSGFFDRFLEAVSGD